LLEQCLKLQMLSAVRWLAFFSIPGLFCQLTVGFKQYLSNMAVNSRHGLHEKLVAAVFAAEVWKSVLSQLWPQFYECCYFYCLERSELQRAQSSSYVRRLFLRARKRPQIVAIGAARCLLPLAAAAACRLQWNRLVEAKLPGRRYRPTRDVAWVRIWCSVCDAQHAGWLRRKSTPRVPLIAFE